MLTLEMKESTAGGNPKNCAYIYTNEVFTTKFPRQRDDSIIYQFIIDQKLRYAIAIKEKLEKLNTFPVIILDDRKDCLEEEDPEKQEDLTKEYLKEMIRTIEKYMGKLEYTTKRTKKEKGVIQYLKENGVEIE